jgi:hypothetical protein
LGNKEEVIVNNNSVSTSTKTGSGKNSIYNFNKEGTVSRRPIIIFLVAVNVIFNLISKLPVHTAQILQNRCYLILNVYAIVSKASVHINLFLIDFFCIFLTPNLTLRSWDNYQLKRKSE